MIEGKKVLAVTLARGGSKSIPKKNIVNIEGKPLIAYTIEECLRSKYIDDYLVSTDDREIREVSKKYGANVPFLRPSNLAQDTTQSVDAILHAYDFMHGLKGEYDYIVEIMCTNPLKTHMDIDSCIELLDKSDADSVVSVARIFDHHPRRVKKIENGLLIDICDMKETHESRRQDLKPPAYIRNGSIYAFKRETLTETKTRTGTKCRPYIMPEARSVNIDEEQDIAVAEYWLDKRKG